MYSDDKNSASRGGFLSNQLPNMLPAQYIDVFTQIGKDSVSRPFKTRFGWHIVQFTGVVPLRKYEQQKEEIIDRISRDSRGYYAVDMLINRVKQDYKYRVDSVAVDELYSVMSDSVFESAWQLPSDAERFGRRIMFIGDTSFAQKDLLDFIYEHQMKQLPMDMTVFLYMMTDNFGKIKILEYIREHFEDRYPELKNNIKDYYEGELIFAITDRNVWTASVIDSLGLAEFYNKNKSNYMYTRRADAVIWTIDSASDNIAKISKIIDKRKRKGKTNDEVKEILLKKGYHVNYYWNCFERGSNIIIDRNIFDKGLAKNTGKFPVCITDNQPVSGKRSVLYVNNILEPSVKPLDVCRGLCISDYQAYLEKNWMQQLHDKYKVRINYEALDSLIKK